MRNAFIEHLIRKVEEDDSIFLVVGDLGYTVVDPFVERYPERFLNAGVSEQNMTAVAAGLAKEGYKVFTYSIANFTTLRCVEQIRNDVCYHDLPVCVVSVGGGFMYGYLGPTHHATEDIAVLRSFPNMRVFVPFSRSSACRALDEVLDQPGPAYIRLGREGVGVDGVQHNGITPIKTSKPGGKRAVISIGKLSDEIFGVASQQQADLFALCRINPLPEEDLRPIIEQYDAVTVIEDHQRNGGAFSAIAEFASPIRSISIGNQFAPIVDGEDGLRQYMLFDGAEA